MADDLFPVDPDDLFTVAIYVGGAIVGGFLGAEGARLHNALCKSAQKKI